MREFKMLAFTALILVLLSLNAHADQWSKTYGGSSSDKAAMIQQTTEGGYIAVGSTSSFGAGKQDMSVLKLDVSGNVEWQKTFGGAEDDEAASVRQTEDGGYVVAGYTLSFGAGKKDVWVLKLDKDGNVEWQKTYGGAEDDEAVSVQQTEDGGYVVAGYTLSSGAGKKDVWVLKLDKDGNVTWQKTYGGPEDDAASSVQQADDGGYIVAATTSSFGAGKKDIWVVKLDKDGNAEWQKTYGMAGNEGASSVRQTSDQGYIVTGWTDSSAPLKIESWILKLDSVGNVQTNWQLTYGGGGDDKIYSIEPTTDGKYIVAGSTDSFGIGKKDAWVMKLDGNGNIAWQKTWGGSSDDEVFSVQQSMDGGYVVAGWSNSFSGNNYNAWISKFDSNGNITGCPNIGNSNATIHSTLISGVANSATPRDSNLSPQLSYISAAGVVGTLNVLCVAPGPDIAVDPSVIDFDSVVMGASSSKTVTVRNLGSQDLVTGTIDITGTNNSDFGIREDSCSGQTLQPSSSCTVEVSFSPTLNGKRSGNLFIPSNDSDFANMSVPLNGEGIFPIEPSAPSNHASFSVCSLYSLPTFSWEILRPFIRYEIHFSQNINFNPVAVTIGTKVNETTIKSNLWKKILLIPGGAGGPVYWRVKAFLASGPPAYVSNYRSIVIEPGQPVGNSEITPTSMSSSPVISWDNNCNVRFKVWFGTDSQFSKKYAIPYTIKNPLDNEGKLSRTLTSPQWNSVRKLVGNHSGSTIHWKVESWDGVNRNRQTAAMSFVLEE